MSIVITGASGFLGCSLVPILMKNGETLLLVGRNKQSLQKTFPNVKVTDYEGLDVASKGFDTLVHLAVRNNNKTGSLNEFRDVNVKLLKQVVRTAKKSGISTIVFLTTAHANAPEITTPYAKSKQEAEVYLAETKNINIIKLRLPAVYGDKFSGKLQKLMLVPKFLRPLTFKVVAAFKPTVHVNRVAEFIQNIDDLHGRSDVTLSSRQEENWIYAFVKRVVDLSFVAFVVILLWWVLISTWIAVRFSSPGGAIFAQKRVGKNGTIFTCFKFRTMVVGTENVSTHQVAANSITKIGAFLRKTKIDELPQIWNILKNELSLIGPRPCLPSQTELVDARRKFGVLKVKGGITGWAQIQGVDMSDPHRLAKLDAEYLDSRGLILDFKIVIATATGNGQGDKVRPTTKS